VGFGKRKVKQNVSKKEHKDESKSSESNKLIENKSKKLVNKDSCIDSNNSGVDGSSNISNIGLKEQRTLNFMKKAGKNKSSNILLFGVTKKAKLELFIHNLKLLHPKMPDFWLENEINKFKKKFSIKDNK